MRTDGTFTTFSPFWNYASGSYFTSNPGTPNVSPAWWTFTKSLSIYSTDGHELENRDALNRYSAATYGYDNMLPLSISNNSRFQEVGFDGFEDRAYNVCNNNLHFGFVPTTGVSYDYSRAHTGKYSLKVNNGSQSSLISTYTINCINQSATSGSN
ncbi:MAG TPA: hypothetical protein VKG26_10415 [Bacteroidia bacterium]|nr:hypothetical protein [Bacteroidia bacterium]